MRFGSALLVLLVSGCASTSVPQSAPVRPATPAAHATAAAPHATPHAAPQGYPVHAHAGDVEPAEATPLHLHDVHGDDLQQGQLDDGFELPEEATPPAVADPQTVVEVELTDDEIRDKVKADVSSLGPMSVGRTSNGALVNGVRLPKSELYKLIDPGHAYGTQETIDYLKTAIQRVHDTHAETEPMRIGHLSAKKGGSLRPHRSHQSGRDVDVSYYYKQDRRFRWYTRAHTGNLDVARTWTFVRALLTETDAEFIFINTSIQKLLKEHAIASGEDKEWLDSVFQYKSGKPWPIIRHAHGHDTHIHVRFYNPKAQEMGRRAYPALVAHNLIEPQVYYTRYKVRKGEILGRLAKRFGTSVKAIRKANRLRSSKIMAGRVYLIPKKGGVKAPARRSFRRADCRRPAAAKSVSPRPKLSLRCRRSRREPSPAPPG